VAQISTLYEDAGLLVVDKPAGLLTIPGRGPESGPDVQHLLEGDRGEKLWVVHRLDRGTSGALAFARNAEVHRKLCQAFEAGTVHKRYLALVQGRIEADSGIIDIALVAGRRGRMRPARHGEVGKASQTHFRVLERFASGFTWLELEPKTGRQHQLRVHLCALGHSLAVDETYRGSTQRTAAELGGQGEAVILARTPLHCAHLELPLGPRAIAVDAPLPEDLQRALSMLRGQP
jgi:RluA family pseudouridine synthase